MNAGKPPLTYKQFQRIIEGMEPPAKPVPTLTLQVGINQSNKEENMYSSEEQKNLEEVIHSDKSEKMRLQMLGTSTTPLQDDHDEKFGVPSLEELGFDCESLKPPVWHGGEMEALSRRVSCQLPKIKKKCPICPTLSYLFFIFPFSRLERHLERKAWVASFGLPKMTPQVKKHKLSKNNKKKLPEIICSPSLRVKPV